LGVANALAAVRAGASQVQGTINGFGERVGNCNLVTVVACLQLKMGRPVVTEKNLARLRDLSVFVDEVANQRPNPRAPFVGNTAFAHKGGIHVNAINKLSKSYEHIQPELVGNSQRVLVGELAGRSNVVLKARQLGLDLSEKNPAAREVLDQVKKLEALGFEFESADASFEILTKKVLKQYKPFFELLDYHVSIRKNNAPPFQYDKCEAILKLKTGEKTDHTADEGDGPVNALDKALRKALVPHFPQLANMRLVDYKVRIVDSTAGTGASTRVLIESTDGVSNWTTVGVSVDIIEASWIALRDSVEYLLSKTTT
jgi:2-isopropylmalate synthase